MELDKCIIERKSTRLYSSKNVDDKLILECLNSAIHAPSAGNSQCWKFIIVRDKEKKNNIMKLCDNQEWMLTAPVFIVACSDISKVNKYYGTRGEALYAIQSVAASIQNLLLKAHDLGLSSCWIGTFDESEVSRILGVGGDARPQAIITLGYSKNHDEEHVDREPLYNFIFFESWGNRDDKSKMTWPLGSHVERTINHLKDRIHESVSKKK